MPKFTPGPWKLIIEGSNPEEHDMVIKDGKGCVLVWWTAVEGVFDEEEANANLIAAAPEIYEVLQIIVGQVGHTWPKWMLDMAELTLAKADGKVIE